MNISNHYFFPNYGINKILYINKSCNKFSYFVDESLLSLFVTSFSSECHFIFFPVNWVLITSLFAVMIVSGRMIDTSGRSLALHDACNF